jgi:hypothetical protein
MDPSYPAFRVPFVDLTEDAHRPFWAEDALKGVDAGAGGGNDGGTGGFDAGACITATNDCSNGFCCSGLQCYDDGTGAYRCGTPQPR